ncbi:hypothetical protein H9635_04040 [Solibacillus sp. A46]|uniref:Uncharacterized protein n=1 Tax=Solibacillus faecavium TaxID=2762221 RepID=A0ABR8XVD2_9BACL|nr:hypothetical protein [Solibacillus faecavium]MBD8035899.1 hypothetical protein [Solibacillus faecavium]
MSKRFMMMLAVTFIVFISSSIILLNKKIAEPIIIPTETQYLLKGEEDFIRISYVTNRNEDIDLKSIQVGDIKLLPGNEKTNPFFFTEIEEKDSFLQSYQYYDLHSVEFRVSENKYSTVTAASNQTATAFFSNGVIQQFPLKVENITKKKEYLFVSVQSRETIDSGSETIFTITEAGTIEEMETVFPSADIKLFKEGKPLTLPYNTQKGEKLSIQISPNYRIWDSVYQNAILHGKFESREQFTQEIELYIAETPPEKWIEDFVVEKGNN